MEPKKRWLTAGAASIYACARPWCVTFEKTGSARARSPTRPSMTKLTFHYRWLGPILGLRLAIKTQAIVSCLFLSNLHLGFLERYVLWGQNKKALLSRVGLDFEREEKKKGRCDEIVIRKLDACLEEDCAYVLECADNATYIGSGEICPHIYTRFQKDMCPVSPIASPIRIFVTSSMFAPSRRKPTSSVCRTCPRPRPLGPHPANPTHATKKPPPEYKFPPTAHDLSCVSCM